MPPPGAPRGTLLRGLSASPCVSVGRCWAGRRGAARPWACRTDRSASSTSRSTASQVRHHRAGTREPNVSQLVNSCYPYGNHSGCQWALILRLLLVPPRLASLVFLSVAICTGWRTRFWSRNQAVRVSCGMFTCCFLLPFLSRRELIASVRFHFHSLLQCLFERLWNKSLPPSCRCIQIQL